MNFANSDNRKRRQCVRREGRKSKKSQKNYTFEKKSIIDFVTESRIADIESVFLII